MQKLWIASELFYPEETSTSYILTKVANRLSHKYSVNVVCGTPVYDTRDKSESFKIDPKVLIHRIRSITGNKNNLPSRSLRFLSLSFSFFLFLLKNVKKGDKVLIVTNPAPLIILISILKRIKKIHLVVLVHDVFPENTIPAGILSSKSSLPYRLLKLVFDSGYRHADELIVLGRDMKKIFEDKFNKFKIKPNITIIENWGDTENIFPISREEAFRDDVFLQDKIVFQYAGNMGRVQGLLELLDVIKEVKNDLLAFYFVGEGAVKRIMMNTVASNNLQNVFFAEGYTRQDQIKVLNKTDVAFVSLKAGMFGLGVPSKTYNILAAGKPLFYIGEADTEIDLLIKEKNIGYSFQKRFDMITFFNKFNVDCIADLEIKKYNARKVVEELFSEKIILNKFHEII